MASRPAYSPWLPGVRLQADGVVAGDLGEACFEVVDQLEIAGGLVDRDERMDVAELGPGDRHHLRGGVQLHRARAERDHRAVERQVTVAEAAQVAQHLVLAVVPLEHRLGEEVVGATHRRGQPVGGDVVLRVVDRLTAERADDCVHLLDRRGLVERDADVRVVDRADVESGRERIGERGIGGGNGDRERVEPRVVADLEAAGSQPRRCDRREPLDAFGDAGQAISTVPGGVEAGDVGQQHLRRADVGGGLLAPDVLLSGLQRKSQRRSPLGVDAHPDDASRHRARGAFVGGEEPGMRTAESHRHAESLSRADGDVGAELSRRNGQQTRQGVGGDDGDPTEFVDLGDGVGPVEHAPGRRGKAEQRAEQSVARPDVVDIADDEVDADRLGASTQDGDRLRVGVVVHDEAVRRRLRLAPGHGHRLGGGGCLVEQRRVGDVEPGELGDQRLEVQQGFESSLADLGLVRRVRGVPGRILEHVAGDHRGSDGAGVAHPDQARHLTVPPGDLPEPFEGVGFGDATSEPERRPGADRTRHRLREQCVDRVDAEHLQHRGDVVGRRSDVAARELVGLDQRFAAIVGEWVRTRGSLLRWIGLPRLSSIPESFARASPGFPRR